MCKVRLSEKQCCLGGGECFIFSVRSCAFMESNKDSEEIAALKAEFVSGRDTKTPATLPKSIPCLPVPSFLYFCFSGLVLWPPGVTLTASVTTGVSSSARVVWPEEGAAGPGLPREHESPGSLCWRSSKSQLPLGSR